MPRLPESARARRRLIRGGVLGTLILAVVLVAVLIPNRKAANPEVTGKEGPAQLAVVNKHQVATADRRAIDSTLDRFLPAGLTHTSPETAWALAGPEMRSSSSLADWRRGTTPVPYYPVLEKTFHTWRAIDVGPNYVIFNLLVHPQPGHGLGSWVFSGEVVKQGDRWLVNRLYTIAVMNPPTHRHHEIGPADFVAPPPSSQTPDTKKTVGVGILPVVLLLALILLIPATFGAVALFRAQRWRRMVRATGGTELPPLPPSYFNRPETADEEAREPAARR